MPPLQSVFGRGHTSPPRIGPGAASGDRRAGIQCSVHMVLRRGTKNAQSTAAAKELFEERYRSSTPRQVAAGLIKGGVRVPELCGGPGLVYGLW